MNCNIAMRAVYSCVAVTMLFGASGNAATADDSQSPRERVASMTDAEKEALRRKQERFEQLDPARQEELRQLHRRLERTPGADRLRQVMARYDEWLKTLSPGQRADLLELPPADRIARIKEIQQQQESRRVREITAQQIEPEDVRVLFTWVYEFVGRHEAEVLAQIPPPFRQRVEQIDDSISKK